MLPPGFDPQPTLTGDSLLLRPLAVNDFDNLHIAASNPAIWAGHPAKDRYLREVFEPYFQALLQSAATCTGPTEQRLHRFHLSEQRLLGWPDQLPT